MIHSPHTSDRLTKVVILNPKGGSGKTTLATNLAACIAASGDAPTLIDCDPQGYCLRWLEKRPRKRPRIHGIAAFDRLDDVSAGARSVAWPESRHIIIDLPAALEADQIFDFTYDADRILVPVMPSSIDAYAASRFIAELLLNAQIDRRERQLAVIANRVRRNTRSYRRLNRFLTSLKIPLIGELRDSQNFVTAADQGLGVTELPAYRAAPDIEAISSIHEWLSRGPEIELEQGLQERYSDVEGVTVLLPTGRMLER